MKYFEKLFNRLIRFIKQRILSKEKDRSDYMHFSKELYEHGILNTETMEDINDNYIFAKEHDSKKDKNYDKLEL